MERLVVIGRIFFALAIIGLGAEHFIFADFVTGRAPPWPEGVPGGLLWAYASGAGFILIGAAILARRWARPAALLAALLLLITLLRHAPILAADALFSSAWTRAGKALTFFGGSLAIAATLPRGRGDRGPEPPRADRFTALSIMAGRLCLAAFLVLTGIQHFLFTPFVASLIPAWFPGDAVLWTYFAGVALIAGGIGLCVPVTARLAALLSGLMVFSWFWIVHLPRTFVGVSDSIAVFEALAVSGIALVLAGAGGRVSRKGEGAAVGEPLVEAASGASPEFRG